MIEPRVAQNAPKPPPLDDDILVDRAVDGDYQAFEMLVRRHQEQAYRVAWSMVKDDTDARDVVQDAFLNIYRKLHTFEGDSAFSSWMYRIVVNTSLMRLRKEKRRSEISTEDLGPNFEERYDRTHEAPSWRIRADEALENKELRQKIIDAVDQLEPKYKTAFLLREIEDLNLQEIAEVTEVTVAAAKSRLHRARLFLRATLEPYLT